METAHSCFSWNDRTIGDVVKKLCEQAKVQLELNPAFKETKDFICQYEESDFDFIRRLAHQYQEWMYFDGTKLIFGKPRKLADPIILEYGTTLSSLDIGLQTLARSEQVFSYHSGADREMQRMTPDLAYGHDKLAGEAFRASLGMFSKPARQHALPRISNETELINYMGRKQAAETAKTHYITAESQVPTLRVGSVISLYSSFLERVGNISKESLGNFIIIEITHEVSQGSYYKNRFKAIPATIKALPSPKVRMPLAETQMATVLSNADPQGKDRVRVRMNWQTDGMQTGWVRVMTPDGGSSKDARSNRGFVFIPEVGDQVLLGFRHGDPARPYVLGSLFNGVTDGGRGQGNNCKSLTSRTGSSLKLDDSKGSVTLHDKGGVSMTFDGAGNSTLNAKATHSVNVGDNASINVGTAEKGQSAPSCLTMDSAGNIKLNGTSNIHLEVDENTYIDLTPGHITINAAAVSVIGTDSAVIGTTKVTKNPISAALESIGNALSCAFNNTFGAASSTKEADSSAKNTDSPSTDTANTDNKNKVVLTRGLEVDEKGVMVKGDTLNVTIEGKNVNIN